jgi:hypothetical protein
VIKYTIDKLSYNQIYIYTSVGVYYQLFPFELMNNFKHRKRLRQLIWLQTRFYSIIFFQILHRKQELSVMRGNYYLLIFIYKINFFCTLKKEKKIHKIFFVTKKWLKRNIFACIVYINKRNQNVFSISRKKKEEELFYFVLYRC